MIISTIRPSDYVLDRLGLRLIEFHTSRELITDLKNQKYKADDHIIAFLHPDAELDKITLGARFLTGISFVLSATDPIQVELAPVLRAALLDDSDDLSAVMLTDSNTADNALFSLGITGSKTIAAHLSRAKLPALNSPPTGRVMIDANKDLALFDSIDLSSVNALVDKVRKGIMQGDFQSLSHAIATQKSFGSVDTISGIAPSTLIHRDDIQILGVPVLRGLFVIIGGTGSGKSFITNTLIHSDKRFIRIRYGEPTETYDDDSIVVSSLQAVLAACWLVGKAGFIPIVDSIRLTLLSLGGSAGEKGVSVLTSQFLTSWNNWCHLNGLLAIALHNPQLPADMLAQYAQNAASSCVGAALVDHDSIVLNARALESRTVGLVASVSQVITGEKIKPTLLLRSI